MIVLFCSIGWMENYRGKIKYDTIRGGGKHVEKTGRGNEMCNFVPNPADDCVYGFVQRTHETIDLTRLGGRADDEYLDDVTIIWVATHHIRNKSLGTKIVGWYRHARVFKRYQSFQTIPLLQKKNGINQYIVKTSAHHATLLPIDARTFVVPRAQEIKGFIGQNNVWYADKDVVQDFVANVLQYIDEYDENEHSSSLKKPKYYSHNQERKVQVEQAAINVVWQYFEDLRYDVCSVEKDNCGWDLEAKAGKTVLHIEVKGLSGDTFNVGLTPNEYKAFKRNAENYRLAVVLNALHQPQLWICRFSAEQNAWIAERLNEKTKILNIEPIDGANISC